MNKMMKTAFIVTTLMLSFVMIIVFGNAQEDIASETNVKSKLEVEVLNSNISINSSDKDEITYEYKKEFYDVVEDDSIEGTKKVVIKLKVDVKPSYNDRLIINVPTQGYKDLIVKGNKSGIGIGSFDMDFDIINENGSVSMVLPKAHNVKFKAVNGSGMLNIGKYATNYTINMVKKDSTIVVPFEDYVMSNNEYQHIEGDGTSTIDINIEKSSFVLSN